ncbi:MAG: hypothetical protein ACKVTZ_23790 [Bacteroidia bacterium]
MTTNLRKIFLLLVLGLLSLSFIFAGNDIAVSGGRTLSLGRAYTAVRGDVWALSYNPASIAFAPHVQVGMFTERRFMMKELTFGNFSAVVPFKGNHAVGLEAGSFGFAGYRETKVSAAYAIHFQKVISIGTKFNFLNTNIENIGSVAAFSVDLGLNARISNTLTMGASASNVTLTKFKRLNRQQPIPTVFTAGIAYTPSDKILIVADVQKDIAYPVSLRGGIEYKINQIVRARMGVSSAPLTLNAGIGVEWKSLAFDFSNSLHEKLGYTPAFSLSYRLGKREEKR